MFCSEAFLSESPSHSHPHLLHAHAVLQPVLVQTTLIYLGGNSVKALLSNKLITANGNRKLQPVNNPLNSI